MNISNSSGVYKITCVANGKIYIGSSVNLLKRRQEHWRELRGNYHSNPHLQSAWNKYGEQSFTFEIIESINPNEIIDREQYWLNTLKPYDRANGFNIAIDASSPSRGVEVSRETRLKISNAHKGRKQSIEQVSNSAISRKGVKRTFEQRQRIKEGIKNSGRSYGKRSLDIVEKSAEPQRKSYIVTTPDGIEIFIKGIVKFCRENGLDAGKMVMVSKNQRPHHKGWKCRVA